MSNGADAPIEPMAPKLRSNATKRICLVVLAAGISTRFGPEDKLGAELQGKPLAHHILGTLRHFEWGQKCLSAGGMLSSLHAGAEMAEGFSHTMVCLPDMPFVTKSIIAEPLDLLAGSADDTISSKSPQYTGPPAIIPIASIKRLPKQDESGARSLLIDAGFVTCPPEFLLDVHTKLDLGRVSASLY